MRTSHFSRFILTTILAGLVGFSNFSHGSIITAGSLNVDGTHTGTLQITADINLPITADGNVNALVLDERVTTLNSERRLLTDNPGDFLYYQINGGTPTFVAVGFLVDNWWATTGPITPKDGIFSFGDIPVHTGDVLTIKATSPITFNGSDPFNPEAIGTFNGMVFAADYLGAGALLSSSVAVPEPGAYGLAGAMLLGVFAARRRVARKWFCE